MKFFQSIKKFFKGMTPLPFKFPFFLGMGSWGNALRKTSVMSDPMGGYAGWVYAALSKRAKRVASVEHQLYSMAANGDIKEIDDHEILSLLYKPNPYQTGYQFKYMLEIMLGIWGQAPIYKDRQDSAKILRLWPLRPDLLKMITDTDGQTIGYEYNVDTRVMRIKPEDIIINNEPNPQSLQLGYSPMHAAALEIDTDTAAAIWNKCLIDNWAEPGGVLETDAILDDKVLERVKEAWAARQQGVYNAGRSALLEAGLKYKPIGRSPKEMEMVESRKNNRNSISVMLGVPMALMTSEDVNLANAEVAERIFNKDTIEPQLKLIYGSLNEDLVIEYGVNLYLDFESPVKEDVQEKINIATAGEGKWMTVNEARDLFNLEPLEGGDAIYKPMGVYPQVGEGAVDLFTGSQVDPSADPTKAKGLILKSEFKKMKPKERRIKSAIMARSYKQRTFVSGVHEKIFDKLNGMAKTAHENKIVLKAKAGVKITIKSNENKCEHQN